MNSTRSDDARFLLHLALFGSGVIVTGMSVGLCTRELGISILRQYPNAFGILMQIPSEIALKVGGLATVLFCTFWVALGKEQARLNRVLAPGEAARNSRQKLRQLLAYVLIVYSPLLLVAFLVFPMLIFRGLIFFSSPAGPIPSWMCLFVSIATGIGIAGLCLALERSRSDYQFLCDKKSMLSACWRHRTFSLRIAFKRLVFGLLISVCYAILLYFTPDVLTRWVLAITLHFHLGDAGNMDSFDDMLNGILTMAVCVCGLYFCCAMNYLSLAFPESKLHRVMQGAGRDSLLFNQSVLGPVAIFVICACGPWECFGYRFRYLADGTATLAGHWVTVGFWALSISAGLSASLPFAIIWYRSKSGAAQK